MIEVRDLFPKNRVFEKRRPSTAGLQGVLIISDLQSLISSKDVVVQRNLMRFTPNGGVLPFLSGLRAFGLSGFQVSNNEHFWNQREQQCLQRVLILNFRQL